MGTLGESSCRKNASWPIVLCMSNEFRKVWYQNSIEQQDNNWLKIHIFQCKTCSFDVKKHVNRVYLHIRETSSSHCICSSETNCWCKSALQYDRSNTINFIKSLQYIPEAWSLSFYFEIYPRLTQSCLSWTLFAKTLLILQTHSTLLFS